MSQIFQIIGELNQSIFWLSQVPVTTQMETPEEASIMFSGPQFFMALIAGIVLAFAFQLLLTNLSVAAGISYLGHKSDKDEDHNNDSGNLGSTIRKIETTVGIWTLVTVTIALFFACLLAVKLSLSISPGLGAIIGLVIWATYFSLLVWVSSTTVGSLIGSVVNTATSGFQSLVGTATAALGAKAASSQVVATAEAAAAAVRREFGSALDPVSIRETLEDYVGALKPPELDVRTIRQEFENLLNDPQLKAIASEGELPNLDRQTFVDLVSSRTDLSKRDVNRLAAQLEDSWKKVTRGVQKQGDWMGQLVQYLKDASPTDLISDRFSNQLDSLVDELRQRRQSQQQQQPTMMGQAMALGFNTLMGVVMGRTDLSDFDAEKIVGQLKQAKEKVTDQADKVTAQLKGESQPYSALRIDIENYLLNTYSWQMTPATINRDFRNVLYDPQADPGAIRRELEQFNRADFVDFLSQRGVFTQERIQELASYLEAVRLDVLETVTLAQQREKGHELRQRVDFYLRLTPKNELTPDGIQRDFKALLEDSDSSYQELRDRLSEYDREILIQMLAQRQDLNRDEAREIIIQLETTRDLVLAEAQGVQEAAQANVNAQWQKLEHYLRSTGKAELNPEGIKRDLNTLLHDPQAGIWAMRARLSRFDRDTLVQLLSQRQDLSEEEVNQIIDRVDSSWNRVIHTPQALAGKAKEQYDRATNAIAEYLRNTGKEELNPESIQRDLSRLLQDPKAGATAIRDRLSRMDRDTLVQLLAQRNDMSEAEANRLVDQLQNNISQIVRTPRRLATRAQQQVQDFQTTLEDYLRNTGKDELNPRAIKRDLQLLLHDPLVGMESVRDRLARFDRSTIVALLSQREDISEAEANRIVDQILSVRDQFMEQLQTIQNRIQSVIDNILAAIRNYLNSLERPELNYEGIKHDVRSLFDDPEAGFEALRDRLGQFDRNTLVAIISSRPDISEADANRLVDQIERARNSVLQRAERLQLETQRRLEQMKYQAQRQVEETRKAAESAAWWLFGTALVSAAASAIAGALAVG